MTIGFDENEEGDSLDVKSTMNMTPLIDVLLVLLVMFIVTIPIQLHSANIEMPAGSYHAVLQEPLIARIEIGANGQITWNGEAIDSKVKLDRFLAEGASAAEQPEIHIHPNPAAPYDVVALVIARAQQVGLRRIGIVGLDEYDRE